MMQETRALQITEGKRPVVMKSGLIHWMSERKAEEFENLIRKQTGHQFIGVHELGITINTAQIEGVYTIKEYDDLCKKNQGMWQCAFARWHKKGIENCNCASEEMKKIREEQKKLKDAQDNKPMTEEDKVKQQEYVTLTVEEGALKGSDIFIHMFRSGGLRVMRKSTLKAWEKKHGPVNPKILERITFEDETKKIKKEANEVFN